MFKKKLDIKRIFLPKKDERRGGWRELHCEELDNLHSSRVIFRMVNWRAQLTNYAACMGHINLCKILYGKCEEKRPLVSLRCRQEDNIKVNIMKTWCESVDWLFLTPNKVWGRSVVNITINLRVPKMVGKFLTCWVLVSSSWSTLLSEISCSNTTCSFQSSAN